MSKKTAKEKLDSIGFVYGYKEVKQIKNENQNTFEVSHKVGISEKYPKGVSNKKDFWVEEIKDGQYSELFINPNDLKEGFLKELENQKEDQYSFVTELYNTDRYLFTFPIDLEDYKVLNAMFMSQLYIYPQQRWESEDVYKNLINEIGTEYLKNKNLLSKKTPFDILQEYQEIKTFLYEKSLNGLSELYQSVEDESPEDIKEEYNIFKSKKNKI